MAASASCLASAAALKTALFFFSTAFTIAIIATTRTNATAIKVKVAAVNAAVAVVAAVAVPACKPCALAIFKVAAICFKIALFASLSAKLPATMAPVIVCFTTINFKIALVKRPIPATVARTLGFKAVITSKRALRPSYKFLIASEDVIEV